MDSGEVIPGLNQDWTLGGAKVSEWIGGAMMFMIAKELFFTNIGRNMPWLMMIWVASTFGLAALRNGFPDEERGLRNAVMTAAGFSPPNLPTPAAIQPYWSGAPLRALKSTTPYMLLGLEDVIGDGSNAIADSMDQNLMR